MKEYFEVGQTVWDRQCRQGVVDRIDRTDNYSYLNVYVAFIDGNNHWFTCDGKYFPSSNSIELFQQKPKFTYHINNPIIEKPIVKFEQGELVFACSSIEWFLRYYSHTENGKHYCFRHQKNKGDVVAWAYIRKLNDNPLLTT